MFAKLWRRLKKIIGRKSPLDIPDVDLGLSADEIVPLVRESRRYTPETEAALKESRDHRNLLTADDPSALFDDLGI